ncbi:hypothetical protein QLX08_004352 [Tetragonisca angustula]|uniref:Uncharacterized protein n=1 Tax=Tetragonisca angustula TaxID=166442 RepID=A0AAW1A2C7_9HYME
MFKRFILLQTTLNIVLCENNMPDNLDSPQPTTTDLRDMSNSIREALKE